MQVVKPLQLGIISDWLGLCPALEEQQVAEGNLFCFVSNASPLLIALPLLPNLLKWGCPESFHLSFSSIVLGGTRCYHFLSPNPLPEVLRTDSLKLKSMGAKEIGEAPLFLLAMACCFR